MTKIDEAVARLIFCPTRRAVDGAIALLTEEGEFCDPDACRYCRALVLVVAELRTLRQQVDQLGGAKEP